jgi:hypothetical protein
MVVANTLAYYGMATITTVIIFVQFWPQFITANINESRKVVEAVSRNWEFPNLHGEHSGHAQADSGRSCSSVDPGVNVSKHFLFVAEAVLK